MLLKVLIKYVLGNIGFKHLLLMALYTHGKWVQ